MESYYFGDGKRWTFTDHACDADLNLRQEIPDIIVKLLLQREIKSAEEMHAFLNPTLEALHDPFLLEGMEAAAERIIRAVQNKEKILVYGDYDVDGVTATSILSRFFKSLNNPVEYYIPDRVDEGYGISDAAVEFITGQDYDLMITVDCGITARFQVEAIYERMAARGKEMDIIITDHHQCNEQLMPHALAVINPHIPGSEYPFKHLCGAGIALKLVQAIGSRIGKSGAFLEYLDLAAIATIADVVELKGENRIITKFGVDKIQKSPCMGIKALLKAAGVQAGTMDSYRIAFALAPRINAAGRMGDAKLAVSLLTCDNEAEADTIAQALNTSNTKRQEVQDDIFKSAREMIDSDPQYRREKVLVVYGRGWHHGVIGIVASKLVDFYHKPAFVIAVEDDKAVGSGRSIPGFNLFNAMESVSDILVKFGGHEQAGGLTLMAQDLEYFREKINDYAKDRISDDMLVPEIPVQLHIDKSQITLATARMITKLEPFGAGNPMPLFCFRGAVLLSKKPIGNGKHLRLTLGLDGISADAVYFGKGPIDSGLFIGDRVDIIFTMEINNWQNVESLQIKVWDMRLCDELIKRNRFMLRALKQVECLDCDDNWLYNGIIDNVIKYDDIEINRDTLAVIYKYISRLEQKRLTLADLFIHARIIANETKRNINSFKLFVALLVFDELELIGLELDKSGAYRLIPPNEVKKVNLEDSEILDWVKQAAQGF